MTTTALDELDHACANVVHAAGMCHVVELHALAAALADWAQMATRVIRELAEQSALPRSEKH